MTAITTSAAARKAVPARDQTDAAQGRKALRCRRKFLRYFPRGFRDATYVDWERGYKARAHEQWTATLGKPDFRALLLAGQYAEVAARAVRLEARTNLLFSFEKMALRDAVRVPAGARAFAEGLYALVYGGGGGARRFDAWCAQVAALPRKQTRVLTWPTVTVFPFLALPAEHFFFKPSVTRRAAEAYGVELAYASRPSWASYEPVLELAARVRRDLRDLRPRDLIDIQSFLWVQGSDEYP
jgi:hypothetical protein